MHCDGTIVHTNDKRCMCCFGACLAVPNLSLIAVHLDVSHWVNYVYCGILFQSGRPMNAILYEVHAY